ncbi:proteoglycan 4-like [Thrips palmi]|uniref:Proteoglycan 4-like n=1 Tax=Thrips palmi TaxID=161013 RepID=A0A6P8YK05_THRPL|nr:proteoglycan 4-like [Thrips palmi]
MAALTASDQAVREAAEDVSLEDMRSCMGSEDTLSPTDTSSADDIPQTPPDAASASTLLESLLDTASLRDLQAEPTGAKASDSTLLESLLDTASLRDLLAEPTGPKASDSATSSEAACDAASTAPATEAAEEPPPRAASAREEAPCQRAAKAAPAPPRPAVDPFRDLVDLALSSCQDQPRPAAVPWRASGEVVEVAGDTAFVGKFWIDASESPNATLERWRQQAAARKSFLSVPESSDKADKVPGPRRLTLVCTSDGSFISQADKQWRDGAHWPESARSSDSETPRSTPRPRPTEAVTTRSPAANATPEAVTRSSRDESEPVTPRSPLVHGTVTPRSPVDQETVTPRSPVVQESVTPRSVVQETTTPRSPVVPETVTPRSTVVPEIVTPRSPVDPETVTPRSPVLQETVTPRSTVVQETVTKWSPVLQETGAKRSSDVQKTLPANVTENPYNVAEAASQRKEARISDIPETEMDPEAKQESIPEASPVQAVEEREVETVTPKPPCDPEAIPESWTSRVTPVVGFEVEATPPQEPLCAETGAPVPGAHALERAKQATLPTGDSLANSGCEAPIPHAVKLAMGLLRAQGDLSDDAAKMTGSGPGKIHEDLLILHKLTQTLRSRKEGSRAGLEGHKGSQVAHECTAAQPPSPGRIPTRAREGSRTKVHRPKRRVHVLSARWLAQPKWQQQLARPGQNGPSNETPSGSRPGSTCSTAAVEPPAAVERLQQPNQSETVVCIHVVGGDANKVATLLSSALASSPSTRVTTTSSSSSSTSATCTGSGPPAQPFW